MQGNDDMTLDQNPDFDTSARTTAVGLEAWLSNAHTESDRAGDIAAGIPTVPPTPEPAMAVPSESGMGPVNAAEAMVLSSFTAARKIVGPDGAELIVDPERSAYYFETKSLKPLQALLQQAPDRWVPVYSEALNSARAVNEAQPLERLRWYAGLIATPGILGRKLARDQRYQLARWPETEREFPRHFRIAKAMLKEAVTADAIAAATGVPYEDVVDYINASHAAGRLKAAVAEPVGPAPAQGRTSRLMARLNKPLFAH